MRRQEFELIFSQFFESKNSLCSELCLQRLTEKDTNEEINIEREILRNANRQKTRESILPQLFQIFYFTKKYVLHTMSKTKRKVSTATNGDCFLPSTDRSCVSRQL